MMFYNADADNYKLKIIFDNSGHLEVPLIAPRIQLLKLINIFFSYRKIRQSRAARRFAMATKDVRISRG